LTKQFYTGVRILWLRTVGCKTGLFCVQNNSIPCMGDVEYFICAETDLDIISTRLSSV
jgi:hypothetical protein